MKYLLVLLYLPLLAIAYVAAAGCITGMALIDWAIEGGSLRERIHEYWQKPGRV